MQFGCHNTEMAGDLALAEKKNSLLSLEGEAEVVREWLWRPEEPGHE